MEINTAFQFYFFNMNFGMGMDMAFGKNHTTLNVAGTIDTAGPDMYTVTPGFFVVDAGGSISPTIINPKFMLNLGFKFGPVILDIPLTYYFIMDNGISIGITVGVVM
jgi:hypothetical protein